MLDRSKILRANAFKQHIKSISCTAEKEMLVDKKWVSLEWGPKSADTNKLDINTPNHSSDNSIDENPSDHQNFRRKHNFAERRHHRQKTFRYFLRFFIADFTLLFSELTINVLSLQKYFNQNLQRIHD